MTDFYPMETTGPQQSPLIINQGYNSTNMPGSGSNVTYTTPCNCAVGGVITLFFNKLKFKITLFYYLKLIK